MRRTTRFFVVVGLICAGVVVGWRLRQRRRLVTAASSAADVIDRSSDTVDDAARWEDEGGALLPQ